MLYSLSNYIIKKGKPRLAISVFVRTILNVLHSERLAAATSSGCIGVIECKTFTIQTTRKLQCSIEQVKKALQIGHYFYAVVLKYLIIRFGFIVKIHFIGQSGAATGYYANAQKKIIVNMP